MVALLAVAAVVYWPARGDEAGPVVEAGAPPTTAAPTLSPGPQPTAVAEGSSPIFDLAATGWLYPSQLPPGFEFDGALDLPTTRVLSFTHADGRVVAVSFSESADAPPVDPEVVLIEGVEWLYSQSAGGLLAGRSYECGEVPAGQMIVASGRVEADPEVLDRDGVADVLLYGLVDERVAEIRVVLSSGTTVVTVPQDISDAFDVDFFVVTFAVVTQEFSDDGARVIALDGDGNEIGEGVL